MKEGGGGGGRTAHDVLPVPRTLAVIKADCIACHSRWRDGKGEKRSAIKGKHIEIRKRGKQ